MPVDAQFIQRGSTLDYTPNADIAAGESVLVGDRVGFTVRAIKANEMGAIAVRGVFDLPKASGGSTAIGDGVRVYWDNTNKVITATAGSNKYLGKTVGASVDADTRQKVNVGEP